MVEVFKTNVRSSEHAEKVLSLIHRTFEDYRANFDLEDCDCILRIECSNNEVAADEIINLLKRSGFSAEVLSDELVLTPANKNSFCPALSRYYNIHLN